MFLFVTSEHRDMLSCGRLCGELTACLGALAHFSSGVESLSTHLPPGERGLGTKIPILAPVSALLPEHDMVGHLSLLHPSAQGGYCHFGFKIQGHAGASPHGSAPHEGQEQCAIIPEDSSPSLCSGPWSHAALRSSPPVSMLTPIESPAEAGEGWCLQPQ